MKNKNLEIALEIEKTVTGPYGPMAVSIEDTLRLVSIVRELEEKNTELRQLLAQALTTLEPQLTKLYIEKILK